MQILGVKEHLVFITNRVDVPESLQKSIGAWSCNLELEGVEYIFLHGDDLLFVELVFTDAEEILQAWWIDFFVL